MEKHAKGAGPLRKAAVSGYFYPKDAPGLNRLLGSLLDPKSEKKKARAVVSPHAGYVYSGSVAGAVFSSVELPDLFVILAPSHRPIRPLFAAMNDGLWETPLGSVPVSVELAEAILAESKSVVSEAAAHAGEHSLEVQLPFIQFLRPEFSFVPIAVSPRATYRDLEELGGAVASGIRRTGREALIVASSDMSHYVSKAEARVQDFKAIKKVLALDPRGLFDIVRADDISMCGFQPVTAALVAARILGAEKADLIAYATSGDMTGDDHEVVGYAGLRIL